MKMSEWRAVGLVGIAPGGACRCGHLRGHTVRRGDAAGHAGFTGCINPDSRGFQRHSLCGDELHVTMSGRENGV